MTQARPTVSTTARCGASTSSAWSARSAVRAKKSPGFTSWDVTNALLQFHLSGADDFALGGDLAYWLREAELRGRKSRALLNGPPGLLFAHALKRAGK